MAKVIVPFDGVADGTIHPRRFQIGETVEGDLARVAIEQGWAEEPGERATKTSRDPFDHDGDGKPGGSLPKGARKK